MEVLAERTKQTGTTRHPARRDTPGHAPINIKALLGKVKPGEQYTVSGDILRQLVDGLNAAIPPPAAPKPRPPPQPQPLWLRPRDAIALYGIRMTLLYKLIHEKKVVAKLIGGARVISVASLDALGETEPQTRRRGRPRRNVEAAD
jgi:hypothetical protein